MFDFFKKRKVAEIPQQKETKRTVKVTRRHVEAMKSSDIEISPFFIPSPPPGVVPDNVLIAQDAAIDNVYAYAAQSMFQEGMRFMGFPYLAELAQRSEYRVPSEIIAEEMTREWIEFQTTGEEDKSEQIEAIKEEFERLKVKSCFQKALEHDGLFGRGQIFIDAGDTTEPITPLYEKRAELLGLTVVEPMWTYPGLYNSDNPLKSSFYHPSTWWVMGREIHKSRMLMLISRPIPDLLKPAYTFTGLSMSQMIKPYVDNWLSTRQAVNDIIKSFSVSGVKTNLADMLAPGGQELLRNRADFFNACRDNRGLMLLDKETEEYFNIITPLTTLDALQPQAQEHMAACARIPLVKLLGVTPSGLNASSDGEIKVFYDSIHSQQETVLRSPITRILNLVQLSIFGKIDRSITFDFCPLWQESATEKANTFKTYADAFNGLTAAGTIGEIEVRRVYANDKDSPFHGIDVEGDLPEVPEEPDMDEEEKEPAQDAEFREEDHPRQDDGMIVFDPKHVKKDRVKGRKR